MDENYKRFHIQSKPRELPDGGRWTTCVVIKWTDRPGEHSRRVFIKRGYTTQEEAAQAGLTFAKEWIDDGKPMLSKSVVSEF